MERFIDDVVRHLQTAGGVEAVRPRLDECLNARKGHSWEELRTNVIPPAAYCTHCLLVNFRGVEFWPVGARPLSEI